MLCVQVVLQRVRDAERRKAERRAEVWKARRGVPADSGSRDQPSGTSDATIAQIDIGINTTYEQEKLAGDANNQNHQCTSSQERCKRKRDEAVNYDETKRRRRRGAEERNMEVRTKKRNRVAMHVTGGRALKRQREIA